MKKLEKLTLKELGESVMVRSLEDQKSIVAGSDMGGYWYWSQETGWTYMLDEVTVTAPRLVEIGSTGTYIPLALINSTPPDPGSPIDLTPEEKFSKACAEGFTDGAKLIAALGFAAACAFFCYYYPTYPDNGSLIVSPTNFQ